MTQDLAQLTHDLLAAAKAAGASSADALAVGGTSLSIKIRNGALEEAERSESTDLGLRVFVGQRSAIVSGSAGDAAAIDEIAQRAVAMADAAPEDPYAGLADPDQLAQNWDIAALELRDPAPEPAPDTLRDMALRAEQATLAVPGVSQSTSTGAGYGQSAFHLATSAGFSGGYARSSSSISAGAISGSGTEMQRDWDSDARIFAADLRSAEEIGRIAGERAVALQGARQAQTGRYPVLFDERISSSLIGHLLAAVNGASVARGSSWLRDSLGQKVLPAGIDLIEEPLRPRAMGSRPFDGEGLPSRDTAIVQDGTLVRYALDLASARKLGMAPTGNASRGTSAAPSPSVSNLCLTPGTQSRDDLIAQMGTGLMVTSLIGSTINPNTGDYSRGASGFWIENGQIAYPVQQLTIAGNLRDMLGRIIPANDARPYLSRLVPSLLIEGLSIAGQ